MTNASNHEDHAEYLPRGPGRRRPRPIMRTAAVAASIGLGVLAAGCGGSNSPGVIGSGLNTSNHTSMAQGLAYAGCMRSHGVSDFPDPTAGSGGGVSFQINGGPGSDLNQNNPTFKAADQACRSLSPGGEQPPAVSGEKLAAEVKWAHCLRSHGLPTFPDPNAQGAFDSSRFDDSSPVFQAASRACASLEPTGPIGAVPGTGPG
jgi:hypothetical protein